MGPTPGGRGGRDSTLDYMDQGSFLGLRALGHGPVIQFTWIYDRAIDTEGLDRFRGNLGRGLLSRLVERSPLPFGRHHWVSWPGQPDIDIPAQAIPPERIVDWADAQAARPIDPEYGPPWRLSVTPLTDGGTAVTLVLSHTVADGVGAVLAIAAAAGGVTRDLGYLPPGSRTKRAGRREDFRRFLRDIPEMGRAVVAAVRLARGGGKPSRPPARTPRRGTPEPTGAVTLPSLTVQIPTEEWDRIAAKLGGTSNSLLVGFAARLGRNLGWNADGEPASLSLPVNERVEGDTRGNALNAVDVAVDDSIVTRDLSRVRADLKANLTGLQNSGYELLGPVALVPLVPTALARRLETMVVRERVIGCSNVGELDPRVNRPDGTDAASMSIRMYEQLTRAELRRNGGAFFPVVSGRVAGALFISVGYTDAGAGTTRDDLFAAVRHTLDEFGLSGTVR